MAYRVFDRKPLGRIGAAGLMLALAGCQSGDNAGSVLDVGLGSNRQAEAQARERISADDLRAYCPPVRLPEPWAIINRYERNGEGDASKLIFQASLTDVTRSCAHSGGSTTITVAVAGRIVGGPAGGAGGAVTVPVRIEVVDAAGQVLHSQVREQTVQMQPGGVAAQFVVNDTGIVIPQPSPGTVRVMAGYDVPAPKPDPL